MTDYDDAPTNAQGPPPPPGRPLNRDQKSAIAAALVGVAALGGAAYGMAQYLEDPASGAVTEETTSEPPVEPNPPVVQTDPPVVPDPPIGLVPPEPYVSDMNRDDMTFEDAFRDARHEMGSGHYFEWHNQLYNTYHKDEWEGMSPDQHQEFLASVYGADAPGTAQGAVLAGGEIPPVVDDVPVTADQGAALSHGTALAGGEIPPAIDVSTPTDHVAGNEPDITIDDSVEGHVGTVSVVETTGEGDMPVMANDVDLVVVDVDGHDVSVFDIDHDGRPDAIMSNDSHVILIDTDHDHVLDTQAVYDPQSNQFTDVHDMENHIAIDGNMDLLHQADTNTSFASDTDFGDDFNNNADITDFA